MSYLSKFPLLFQSFWCYIFHWSYHHPPSLRLKLIKILNSCFYLFITCIIFKGWRVCTLTKKFWIFFRTLNMIGVLIKSRFWLYIIFFCWSRGVSNLKRNFQLRDYYLIYIGLSILYSSILVCFTIYPFTFETDILSSKLIKY